MNTNNIEILRDYPEVLTAKMVAKIVGIGYVNALKLIKHGGIRYIKIGNVYKVPKKGFIEWLDMDVSKEIKFED